LAFLGIFWHLWHFMEFIALNATFGIHDILFFPCPAPRYFLHLSPLFFFTRVGFVTFADGE
jgi:hypothetical protein